jgi:hypothetical protein
MPNILTRRTALTAMGALLLFSGRTDADALPRIRVHKDRNCSCCSLWVRHLEGNGFGVDVEETEHLAPVRRKLGVPVELAACHTAEVDGYVIEGHVPAAAIRQLLQERPEAAGLAVPGMPVGSPGMEGPFPQKFAVILFGKDGRRPYMQFEGRQIGNHSG